MKRFHLLIALFVTSCAMAFGADGMVTSAPLSFLPGTAESAPSGWQSFLNDFLYPGLWSLLALAAAKLGHKAVSAIDEYFRKQIAKLRHGQVIGVIYDSTALAVAKKAKEKGKRYEEMLKDLKVDSVERAEIAADAAAIAESILADIRGYVKDQGGKFLTERIDLALGELQSRLTASREAFTEEVLSNFPAEES